MKYEGLILDVEGVVVPSMDFWYKANTAAGTLELIHGKYLPMYLAEEMSYRDFNSTAVRLMRENGVPLSKILEIARSVSLFPGIERFIYEFKKKVWRKNWFAFCWLECTRKR